MPGVIVRWSGWAAVAAALWTGSAPKAGAKEHEPCILTVGVDEYRSREVPGLRGCANDAVKLAAAFASDRPGGPPAPRTIVNEGATRRRIVAELEALARGVPDGSEVVIGLSGHGTRRGGNWYFLPHDFDPRDLDGTALDSDAILGPVGRLVREKGCPVTLIIDACHAGQLRQRAGPLLMHREGPGGLVLLLSSAASQSSKVDASGDQGLFTLCLLDAFRSGNFERDEQVTLGEVRRYLGPEMHARLRDQPKAMPGLSYGEQDFVMDWSRSLSEATGLTGSNPFVIPGVEDWKEPDRQPADLPVAAGRAPIVGAWALARRVPTRFQARPGLPPVATAFAVGPDGDFLLEEFVLVLRPDSTYTAAYKGPLQEPLVTSGRYHYEPGREFSLRFDNGVDYVGINGLTADTLDIELEYTARTARHLREKIGLEGFKGYHKNFAFRRVQPRASDPASSPNASVPGPGPSAPASPAPTPSVPPAPPAPPF